MSLFEKLLEGMSVRAADPTGAGANVDEDAHTAALERSILTGLASCDETETTTEAAAAPGASGTTGRSGGVMASKHGAGADRAPALTGSDIVALMKQQAEAAAATAAAAKTTTAGTVAAERSPLAPGRTNDQQPNDDMERSVLAMLQQQQARRRAAAKTTAANSSAGTTKKRDLSPEIEAKLADAAKKLAAQKVAAAGVYEADEQVLVQHRDKIATHWANFLGHECGQMDSLEVVTTVSSRTDRFVQRWNPCFYRQLHTMETPVFSTAAAPAEVVAKSRVPVLKHTQLSSRAYVHSRYIAMGCTRIRKFEAAASALAVRKSRALGDPSAATVEAEELSPTVAKVTMDIRLLESKLAFARGDFPGSVFAAQGALKEARRERRRHELLVQQQKFYRSGDGQEDKALAVETMAMQPDKLEDFERTGWTLLVRALLFVQRGFLSTNGISTSWVYRKGDAVRISGLQSEAGKRYNERRGFLTTFKFDHPAPRWGVKLLPASGDSHSSASCADDGQAGSVVAGAAMNSTTRCQADKPNSQKPTALKVKKMNLTYIPPNSGSAAEEAERRRRCFVRMSAAESSDSPLRRDVVAASADELVAKVADGEVGGCGQVFLDWGNVSEFGQAYHECRRSLFQRARLFHTQYSSAESRERVNAMLHSPTCQFDEGASLGVVLAKIARGLLLPSTQNGEVRFSVLHAAVYAPHQQELHTLATLVFFDILGAAAALAGGATKPLDVFFLESSKLGAATAAAFDEGSGNVSSFVDDASALHFLFFEALSVCPGVVRENMEFIQRSTAPCSTTNSGDSNNATTSSTSDNQFGLPDKHEDQSPSTAQFDDENAAAGGHDFDGLDSHRQSSQATDRIVAVLSSSLGILEGFLAFRSLRRTLILQFMRHASHPLEIIHQVVRAGAALVTQPAVDTECQSGKFYGADSLYRRILGLLEQALGLLLTFSGCISVPDVTKPKEIQHFIYNKGLASARAVAAAVYTLGFQTLHPTGSQQLEGTGIDSVSGVSLSRANEEHILVHRGFAASSCIRLLGKCVGVFVNIFANADAVRQVLSVESGSQQKRGWSSANSVVPWEEVLFPLSTPLLVATAATDVDIDSDGDYVDTDDDSVSGGHAADDDSGSDAEVLESWERERMPGPSNCGKGPRHSTVRLGPSARTYAKALKSLVTTLCNNILGLEQDSLEAVRGLVFVEEMLTRPVLRLAFKPSGSLDDSRHMDEEWTDLLRLVDRIRLRFRRKDVVHQHIVHKDPAAPTGASTSRIAAHGEIAVAAQSPQSRHASLLSMPVRSQRLSLPALEKSHLPTLPPLMSTTPDVLAKDKS